MICIKMSWGLQQLLKLTRNQNYTSGDHLSQEHLYKRLVPSDEHLQVPKCWTN